MTPRIPRRVLGAVSSVALVFGATAATFVVTSAAPAGAVTLGPVDSTIPDGNANSLRDVLENQVADGNTVVLEAGATYTLDDCESGDVNVDAAVTIQGNGATIEQTCNERVLETGDDITLENVTVTGGDDPGDQGGGLSGNANVTLTDTTFTGNATEGHGGGVYAQGTLTISGSLFTDNIADSNIGGFGGGGAVFANGPATITGSTFTDNVAYGTGGESSGGAVTSVGATLSIDTSSFSGNTAPRSAGGAISTAAGLSAGALGDGGVISITRSTINGNGAPVGGAYANWATDADITIENSTITGNSSQFDGAIAASVDGATGAALTLVNDTITDNTLDFQPPELGGGAADVDAPSANVHASQIPASTITVFEGTFSPFGTVITGDGENPDCMLEATVDSAGYNYGDDDTCGLDAATDTVTTTDPQLGSLGSNGGPTLTQLPAATSPLLNAIPSGACQVAVDQRGITRPQGTGCDIGSVEIEVAAPIEIAPKFTG